MVVPDGGGIGGKTILVYIGTVGDLWGLGMGVGGLGTSRWEKSVQRRCNETLGIITGGAEGVLG